MYPQALRKTIISLEIIKWLYIGISVAVLIVLAFIEIYIGEKAFHRPEYIVPAAFIFLLTVGIPILLHFTIRGLKAGNYTYWVIALIVSFIALPSLLIIPAGISLYGLFDPKSRAHFDEKETKPSAVL